MYVQDSNNPDDVCRKCPSGASCVNGAPPIFQATKVTGEVELSGLPEDGSDDQVRQALAKLLKVDVSMIVLPDSTQARRRWYRRSGARVIKFAIVGDATQAAALAADLQSGSLASQLSSQLSADYGLNISAQVSGGNVQESTTERPEGEEWEEVNGEYLLRKCAQGFLKVHTP